jgi:hypothetical protein
MTFFRTPNALPYPLDEPHGFMSRDDAPNLCRFCGNRRTNAYHLQEPSTSDGGYTIDTTYRDQLKSPMNLALHWSEDALCWEVIVRYRGKRLGVTQVRRLEDLGPTVFDYVALASAVPMNPGGALADSLLPHDANLTVARIREVIVDFEQLGTPGANNHVTALDTIELIDELLDADDVRLPTSVEDAAHEVVHQHLCSCPGDGVDIHPCPSSVTVGAIVSNLDAAGLLVHREDP